jgi:hypothetical protein
MLNDKSILPIIKEIIMKKLSITVLSLLIFATLAAGQDISGSLSGNLGPGSYNVIDSIWVAAGNTLTLAPGTEFEFAGAFGFGVTGTLHADGNPTDSIKFEPTFGVPFWKGIDILQASAATTTISYCYISGASTSGIYSNFASPTITHCTITNCNDPTYGGGINCYQAAAPAPTPTIAYCVISYCTAQNGGGFHCRNCQPNIHDCTFIGNNGTFGGAMALYFSTGFTINNCLFYGNSGSNAGGGIRFSSAPATVQNSTFVSNSGGSGSALFVINGSPTVKNCIVKSNTGSTDKQVWVYAGGLNVSYSSIEDSLWPGTGNIVANPLFVTGPDGNYYLSQIAAGQTVNSPCVDAGNPSTIMFNGTTRTDRVQDTGTVDMGYHYAVAGAPPPTLDITIAAINPPIIIPANGGSFQYNMNLHNLGTTPATFSGWAKIKAGSTYYPVFGPATRNLPGGANPTRTFSQTVAATIPSGTNYYIGYVGTYPNVVVDSSFFTFTKLTAVDGGPWITETTVYGDFLEEYVLAAQPDDYLLGNAYPNPFNPTTTISFSLPSAGKITLAVCNSNGELVRTMINGWRDAGAHQVTFDGTGLSSGIYIYTLKTGSIIQSGKMILLK